MSTDKGLESLAHLEKIREILVAPYIKELQEQLAVAINSTDEKIAELKRENESLRGQLAELSEQLKAQADVSNERHRTLMESIDGNRNAIETLQAQMNSVSTSAVDRKQFKQMLSTIVEGMGGE